MLAVKMKVVIYMLPHPDNILNQLALSIRFIQMSAKDIRESISVLLGKQCYLLNCDLKCVYVCVRVCVYTSVHPCMYLYVPRYMCVSVCTWVHVCMQVCMCVHVF